MTGLSKTDDSHDYKVSNIPANHEVGSPVKGTFLSGHSSKRSNQKDIICANIDDFQSPREVYKRNGELLEVIIILLSNHFLMATYM
jgi:hypothetical protein